MPQEFESGERKCLNIKTSLPTLLYAEYSVKMKKKKLFITVSSINVLEYLSLKRKAYDTEAYDKTFCYWVSLKFDNKTKNINKTLQVFYFSKFKSVSI